MKRLQLIKNKYVRLFINVLVILLWFLFCSFGWVFLRQIFFALGEVFEVNFASSIYKFMDNIDLLVYFPILSGWIIFTYEIWFGKLRAKAKITSSKY